MRLEGDLDRSRPSPKGMALRRPSLQPRTQGAVRQRTPAPALPRRHVSVDMAWGDTGTLCCLALRPVTLNKVMRLYGPSLVVTEAVAEEVRRMAAIPAPHRTPENRLRCNGADAITRILDRGEIKVCPLPASLGTIDQLGRVLRQLDEIEVAANERLGRTAEPLSSARKHAGEAHSIVSALRTLELGRTTLLLTNDGGAMKVAERNGVSYKHVGDLLAEFACTDPAIPADELFRQFTSMTASFATVPLSVRPSDDSPFSCLMRDDACGICD